MKAQPTIPAVNKVALVFGAFRTMTIMIALFLCYGIASAQAHQPEYASISRQGGALAPSALLTSNNDATDDLIPVNLRAEIGHFFEEPNEGVLKLPFNLSGKSDISVAVTTLDGVTAYHLERKDVAAGQLELVIDLRAAGLSDGEYMVQIGLNRSQNSAHYAQTVALR
jgi:hypothetical protein